MPVGDALFHAHRLDYVLEGRAFFTSVAPGSYTFPYPVLLYAVAAPFALLAGHSSSHVVLLRTIVTAADVLVGVAIYAMVVGAWRDRQAGACALVTYLLFPLGAMTMAWGNLTNLFGQALFVLTTALLASTRLRIGAWRRVWSLAAVMTAAMLTHPSTFGILAVLAGFTWLFYRAVDRSDDDLRSADRAVLLATMVAVGVAVGLYYSHFLGTYRDMVTRIASEVTDSSTRLAWHRTEAGFAALPARLVDYYGWPALGLAAYGAFCLRLVARHDRLRLVLGAWVASCLVFFVVGLLTPVELRYHLAALPVVAILAGLGWSRGWRAHRRWRAALILLAAWMIKVGVTAWVARLA